jgi:tripartite-type tricarboxylate transporter receptor subunit TctC
MKARHLFFFAFLVMLGLGALAPSASFAAGYPDHPIQLIIPYVAGATGDITARMLAEELEKVTGAKIIPNNRPGAGTVLGADATARAKKNMINVSLLRNTIPHELVGRFCASKVVM